MRTFFKWFAITIAGLLVILYLGFLFILPNIINIDNYKEDIVSIVKEQTGFNLSYENPKIQTTPLLSIWLKLENIKISDKNDVQIADLPKLKVRVSLPSIFLMTAKISAIEAESPKISLDITDGSQIDILKQVEEIINNKKQEKNEEETKGFFDPSWIRIKVVNAKLNNYDLVINDKHNKHNLKISGEKLKADYFNGKTFKVKTDAKILSDDEEKINANIKLDCFIPEKTELDKEDDPAENFEISPINPVELYRKFDLKTDLNTDLKIRNKKPGIWVKGILNIENLTFKLSDYKLPPSYIKVQFNGFGAFIDTNIALKENEAFSVLGKVKYANNPKADLNISTDKIRLNTLIELLKSTLNAFDVKNDFGVLKGEGYLEIDTHIKTNFKKLLSDGKLIIKEGKIINKHTGTTLAKIDADIIFNDKDLKIEKVTTNLGGADLNAQGNISDTSNVNIRLKTENMPISNLFNIFAPPSLKNAYVIKDGKIFLDFMLKGKLKNALLSGNFGIKDLNCSAKNGSFNVTNKDIKFDFEGNIKEFDSSLVNNGFVFYIPSTKSKIAVSEINTKINEESIDILPFDVNINSKSVISFNGNIKNYFKKPSVIFTGDGSLNTTDLKQFLGKQAEPFINSQGAIPFNMEFSTEKNKGNFIMSLESDGSNYITPLISNALLGRKTVLKAHVILKPNRLNIRDTGLYLKEITQNSKGEETEELKKVIGITGTIDKLETAPFINVIKLDMPNNLDLSIVNFKNSSLKFGGSLKIFGDTKSPSFKGEFNINDIDLPDILTTAKNIRLLFNGKNLNLSGSEIMINGSDMKFNTDISLRPSNIINITGFDFLSVNTDVDKLLKALDLVMKKIPQDNTNKSASSDNSDIPVLMRNGSFNIHRASVGNITAQSIRGRLSLEKNILSINNLALSVFNGTVNGITNVNLKTMNVLLQLNGYGIDAARALLDSTNVKNAISGTTSFKTDLTLKGVGDYEDLVKSLDGKVNFKITNGQFGGFAKLENFILAENIRESQFFQTALGGIINSIATIDTTHFEEVNGEIYFNKGILHIVPITSKGNVITFNISGDMDILANEIDMKLRGRLASTVSNLLGPLSAINPINIVKNTPGLNIVLAKTFSIFCQSVTQEELNQIPEFNKAQTTSDATNFQIVLRGSLNKPLTLVKSFKWLALQEDIDNASGYVSSLPEPEVIDKKGTVLQTKEEIDAYNAKPTTKIKKVFKKMFGG